MATALPRSERSHWNAAALAALISVVTMPLTAMWFLLAGGVLLVAGLTSAAVAGAPRLGPVGRLGLGLLVGPTIYLGLALIQ